MGSLRGRTSTRPYSYGQPAGRIVIARAVTMLVCVTSVWPSNEEETMTKAPTKRKAADATPPLRNITTAIEQQLGPIEHWAVDRIKVYERDLRIHSDRQMTALAACIVEYGVVMPLLVGEDGTLICGHARLAAAKRLGLPTVPVLVARCWSAARIKAYRLADNRLQELGSWSEKALAQELAEIIDLGEVQIELVGWSTGEVDKILDLSIELESDNPDEVPELPVEPVSQMGDLWLLGKHRLLHGSSLDAAAWAVLMNGQLADLSLNDGPWNVPINGHVSSSGRFQEFAMASGEMTEDEFTTFNATWMALVKSHMRNGALLMAFIDHAHLYELMTAARRAELKHLNMCVWAKTNAGLGSLWRSQYELCLVLKHGTAQHTNCVEMGKHGRHRTNLWTAAGANSFGGTRDADLKDHPTVKPQEILREAIRDVTRQGDLVVDAFSGSGSTILACEYTKRVGYAIEIEGRYVDVAIQRFEAMTGTSAVLAATGQPFAAVSAERLGR